MYFANWTRTKTIQWPPEIFVHFYTSWAYHHCSIPYYNSSNQHYFMQLKQFLSAYFQLTMNVWFHADHKLCQSLGMVQVQVQNSGNNFNFPIFSLSKGPSPIYFAMSFLILPRRPCMLKSYRIIFDLSLIELLKV